MYKGTSNPRPEWVVKPCDAVTGFAGNRATNRILRRIYGRAELVKNFIQSKG